MSEQQQAQAAQREHDERLEDLEPEREDAEAVKGGFGKKDPVELDGVDAQHNETLVRA